MGSMKITISKENYLKTIAEAEAEGETVIAATLARWLQIYAARRHCRPASLESRRPGPRGQGRENLADQTRARNRRPAAASAIT